MTITANAKDSSDGSQTGSGDFKHLVNIRGATAGWVGETGTRSETVTPSLREVVPTFWCFVL